MYKVKRFILGRIVWNLVALLIGQIIMFEIVKDDFESLRILDIITGTCKYPTPLDDELVVVFVITIEYLHILTSAVTRIVSDQIFPERAEHRMRTQGRTDGPIIEIPDSCSLKARPAIRAD